MGLASRNTGRSQSYNSPGKDELGSEAHQHGRDSVFWQNLRRQEEPASAKLLVRKPRRPPPLIPSHGPAILPGISPVGQACVRSCCVSSWQGNHFGGRPSHVKAGKVPVHGRNKVMTKDHPRKRMLSVQARPVQLRWRCPYQRQVSGGRKGDWNMRRCHSE